jgi:Ca-activated chloride channel family protein
MLSDQIRLSGRRNRFRIVDSHPIPLRFIALLIAILVSTSLIVAQDPEQAGDEILRVRTDLVSIPIRVLEKDNRPVIGLDRNDFRLTVDGQVVTADYFSAGAQTLSLLFALDQSGSIREVISQQRQAALDLFSRFAPRSRVAVVRFDDHAYVIAPFGRSREEAERAFVFTPPRNHRTAIFDSVEDCLELFTQRSQMPGDRRIIVLISDGLDTSSKQRADAIIQKARSLGVSIYAIQIGLFGVSEGRFALRRPSKGFRELGDKSGGTYFLVGDSKTVLKAESAVDLAPVFQAIENDLTSQYLLGFYPTDLWRDGREHAIKVEALLPKGRKVRVIYPRQSFALATS